MDIEYLLALQKYREALGSVGDFIWCTISDLGGNTLALVIVGLIFWCINKELGRKIAYSVSIGLFTGQILKDIFCVYRPWIRDARIHPSVRGMSNAGGYSFPSGHAQLGVSIYGMSATATKSKLAKVLLWGVAVVIAFSRNVLGVHTPQDIIVGFIIGLLSIAATEMLFKWNSRSNGKYRDEIIVLASVIIVAIMLVALSLKSYPIDYVDGVILVDPAEMVQGSYGVAGIVLGFVIGCYLEKRFVNFKSDVSIVRRLLRGVFGILVFLSVAITLKKILSSASCFAAFIITFTIIIVEMFVWPAIFNAIEMKKKTS